MNQVKGMGKEEGKNHNNDKVTKITVTKNAEAMLDEMVSKVNNGFTGGKVTRQDVASWIIQYFLNEAFNQSIDEIRAEYFDQLAHFESLLKQARDAKRTGADASAIAAILGKPNGNSAPREVRRRVKKSEESKLVTS